MNKKRHDLKYKNIYPNKNADFEKMYGHLLHRTYQIQSDIQQLAAAHKAAMEQ